MSDPAASSAPAAWEGIAPSGQPGGAWIVLVAESGERADCIGPYRTEDEAEAVAEGLNETISAVGAAALLHATAEWVLPISDFNGYRELLLTDLTQRGYDTSSV